MHVKPRKTQYGTREEYLKRAATILNVNLLKKKAGVQLPQTWFVSVMEPAGNVVGRAWPASSDAHHMFISATLHEPVKVLATLVHEMIHLAVGNKHGHDKVFGEAARAVGLEGKLTATHAGVELHDMLTKLDVDLGTYPHVPLVGRIKPKQKGKSVRVKYVSEDDPGYALYIATSRVEAWGAPKDPAGKDMVPA